MRSGRSTLLVRALLFAGAFLLAPAALAAPQNPELVAHAGEGDDPDTKSKALAIGRLDIDVTIVGDTAHTIVTAQFTNAGSDILEGNFVFDLPPNSAITGYALDIDGKMVDGVLAAPRQAALTFEARERRGIDPGLAEVTRSGAFMTRVYPIVAGKGRTIRLEFVTPLDPEKAFTLPLVTQLAVGAVSIHLTTDAARAPALTAPNGIELKWTRSGGGFEASGTASNRPLLGALAVGPVEAPPVLLGLHRSGDTFFEINDVAPPSKGAAAAPARVRIYWDSSLSRRGADLSKEIELVGHYIDANRPETVDLVFFSTDAPQIRTLSAPSAAAVTAILKVTDYQGGTSFAPVLKSDLPKADACLLFSDGNVTVDSYRAERLPCPLYAVSSAADANRALLTALAQRSGGDYVDLGHTAPDIALASLMNRSPRVVGVKDASGQDIDYEVLSATGNRFRIVGRVPEAGGITVSLLHTAATTRSYALDRATAVANDAPGALWAQRHIDEMSATDRPDKDAVLALARRYSVASPAASFVVFENITDYIAAGAEPPASLGKDVYAQFRAAKAEADAEAARDLGDRLAKMIKMWDDEKTWWQTKFKPIPPRPVIRDKRREVVPVPSTRIPSESSPSPVTVLAGSPAPPPPPPPRALGAPPQNRAAPSGSGDIETVVTTGAGFRDMDIAAEPPRAPAIQIDVAPWNPDRPYIKALNAAAPDAFWSVYRAQEKEHGGLPAFYLDVAEFLFRHGKTADAIKVALNALELPSSNTTTMTILADRLLRYGDEARALWLYDHILYLEPDRPQPRRNLALALVARAEHGGALAEPREQQRRDYARALELLNDVVTHPWSDDYDGIEIVSLMEANRLVPRLKALGGGKPPLDPRLIALLDVDLRIVLEWNTDQTDMDLWVDEPSGERAIYNHPNTADGGRLSNDMTRGYGPEEYLLHRAPNGTYTVRVNVYATDQLNPNGATTVRAHIFRNYGRAGELEETLELELKRSDKDAHIVGTIKVKDNGR